MLLLSLMILKFHNLQLIFFKKGPACALYDNNNIEDLPVLERMIKSSDELEAERLRWAFLNEHNKKGLHRPQNPPLKESA